MSVIKRIAVLSAALALLASPVAAAMTAAADSPAASEKTTGTSVSSVTSVPTPAEAAAAARATAARMAAQDIVDVPVSFTVRNDNRSKTGCRADGGKYRVRGHLTAPASVLSGKKRAVTLYQHGIAAGEWYWRLDVPGYHYAEELAKRGHASVTIDRLGYGDSDRPNGFDTCIGAEADIAHQIVRQLRDGGYTVDGKPAEGPAATVTSFDKVTLAGQSNGGQVVQIAAYSFGGIDGLMIMDWTDRGLTPEANTRFFSALQSCMAGGQPSRKPSDPSGYVYYDLGPDQFRRGNFHDTEQRVMAAATPHQNRHPCGDMTSQLDSVFTDLEHVGSIKVPVLLVYGDDDARVTGGAAHRRLFTGADTALIDIPGAGHYATMARSAPRTFDRIDAWLDARGL
ncbi:alpha/beta hydrolase [Streptomyces sp. ISL-100]|uniref:alpha/beta hydrolase n=1 Tax=Streptomyces sp. ISL-100 TaxID=2819173 RepID=UPI001BEBCCC0|nr:alpha/beta hydrolase [Streptomyces sp. ISL-100]MBT2395489.1 alpha/beta hydrolase [Streptomyces sp. ISL-100]